MTRLSETIEKIRSWIDGANSENQDEIILTAQARTSSSEDFLNRIVKQINIILEDEIIRLPSGKAYVPANFVVYLSEFDDKELRSDKRDFFEKAISELMFDRAIELAGNSQLSSKKIGIRIQIDGTLQDSEIYVKAVSDSLRETLRKSESKKQSNLENTISDLSSTIDDEQSDFKPLCYLEIWNSSKKIEEFPIIKSEITFGRKTEENAANIQLESENRKISRLHCSLSIDQKGEIWITSLHKNPTMVDGISVTNGETVKLEKTSKLEIYEFIVKLRFGD